MVDYDTVIVGGGAAGLSAALTLARSRRKVAVVDAGEPRNEPADHLHGFLSRDGESPQQLLSAGRGEIQRYGAKVLAKKVSRIEHVDANTFAVHCSGSTPVTARSVLVATGLRDELPDIPGLQERWGRDVIHCPYCHGWEVRDGALGVVGGENRPFTMHQAALVRQWSCDVIFFPNTIVVDDNERKRLSARGIRIVDGTVTRVVTRADQLYGVELDNGEVIARSAVFTGPQFVPRDELLTTLGCRKGDNNWVSTDATGSTSVAGVWAAGNVVDSPAQLITAAADGVKSAIAINHHLLEQDIQLAVEAFH